MLNINQTFMFALSMLVITARVGTRERGHGVNIARTKANAGKGGFVGLCSALIAFIADRSIMAGAQCARFRLILDGATHG